MLVYFKIGVEGIRLDLNDANCSKDLTPWILLSRIEVLEMNPVHLNMKSTETDGLS